MTVVDVAVRRPVTVAMAAIAVAIFGWLALTDLPVELLPAIDHPAVTVRTDWAGAAPQEVESLVSRPLEQAVGAIPHLVRVSSVSSPGRSDVTLEFDWGTRMELASLDVREKVDLANLPEDADRPVLLRYDPSLEPVLEIALSWAESEGAATRSEEIRLRRLAEDHVARGLEGLPGVAAVLVEGGLIEEHQVVVDPQRLADLSLDVATVARRLDAENVDSTGGAVEAGDARYLVRTLGELTAPEEALDVVLATRDGAVVRLGDVATVERGAKEREVFTRVDGRPAVRVAVFKEAAANAVTVADAVRERSAELLAELRRQSVSVEAAFVVDQSRFIRAALKEVRDAALWGGVLALLVLFAFLRRLEPTLVVGVAIPVSVLATFFVLSLTGTTLNVMSLGGLALGVGMLVDSAIVVLESIDAKRRDPTLTRHEAARLGASEVGRAVTASVLTTACVFVPVVFVEGVAAALFRDFGLVVTAALGASLFASLTLIPTLSARLGGDGVPRDPGERGTWLSPPVRGLRWLARLLARAGSLALRPLTGSSARALGAADRAYPRLLSGALRRRPLVLLVAAALLGSTVVVLPRLGLDLLPEISRGEVRVDVALPVGTPLSVTSERLAEVERLLLADPEVLSVATTVGESLSRPGVPAEQREHVAHLDVRLAAGVLGAAEDAVVARLADALGSLPALEARFERPALFSFSAPIEVELRGRELPALERAAESVARALESVPELAAVTSAARGGNPELAVRFDRDRLAAAGLTVTAAGQALRDQVLGAVATDIERGERDVDLRVRAPEAVRRDERLLGDLPVATVGGQAVPLRAVATIDVTRGPAEIVRRDHERVALVTAVPRATDLASTVPAVERALAETPLPPGVRAVVAGKAEELGRSTDELLLAVALSIFLVYLVMASQFESFLQPFVILFSVPFALVGGVLALALVGEPLSVVAGIGFVMLSGIVVNNAIVLVDRVNQHRAGGLDGADALVAAGRDRLRPILMTTTTTVLGLLPLALSSDEGAELRVPLAVTVIGGLVLSTLLTLFLIPVLLSYVGARSAASSSASASQPATTSS